MKVTKGELKAGDVIHYRGGWKMKVSQEWLDSREERGIEVDAKFFFEEPTEVTKIIRKKAKEIELKGDDVMQVGDVVRYKDGREMVIKGYAGMKVSSLVAGGYISRPSTYKGVFRRVDNKPSWKETGKMIEEIVGAGLCVRTYEGSKAFICIVTNFETDNDKIAYADSVQEAIAGGYKLAQDCEWLS